jgi:hypothetical protein
MSNRNSFTGRSDRVSQTARVLLFLGAIALLVASVPNSAYAGDDREPYAIGLWGDLPYSAAQAIGVNTLIADMNSQNLAFTAHDGDLKSGGSECTDAVYTQAQGYFASLRAPAIFTPGDNDWVDCDRNPAYNSLVQLDKDARSSSARRSRSASASCASRCSRSRCAWASLVPLLAWRIAAGPTTA